MFNAIRRFATEEDGMEFVEYGLIVAVMVMAAFGAWDTLGGNIKTVIDEVGKKVKIK